MFVLNRVSRIQELSRRKSSLAWEDGEGASVSGGTSTDETGIDEEVEVHQNERCAVLILLLTPSSCSFGGRIDQSV